MRGVGTFAKRYAALALLAAGACGGRAGGESQQTEPSYGPPRNYPPYAAPSQGSSSRPQPAQPMLMPAPSIPPPPQRVPPPLTPDLPGYDLAEAAAENVLTANCGQCHGPALDPAQAFGINFINDTDKLVQAGLIVPLDSAGSRIVQVMVNGSMPPPASGLPPVTEADINTVAQYIDNPRFWPTLTGSEVPDGGAPHPTPPPALDGGTAPPSVDDAGVPSD